MAEPEDFDRVGDLLGDFCEAAASPAPGPTQSGEKRPSQGAGLARATGDVARALAAVWPEVAGAEVAANASPVQLKAGRLVVSTSSSVWANTLQYMGEDLIDRLNQRLGPGMVQRVIFRHAGWEERRRGETADPNRQSGGYDSPAQLSREQEEALAQVEALDIPDAVRESMARAMRASFVRSQRDSVR
jgi:hypothetical protein